MISLISHPSKVMLKIILNRPKPQAERIIAEDQALFKAGRNTTEQTFNIILERIKTDALEGREGTASIGGKSITNLRVADDIDGLAGEEEELAKLVEHLDKASTGYGMEISAEKTKLMTNNTRGINTPRSK